MNGIDSTQRDYVVSVQGKTTDLFSINGSISAKISATFSTISPLKQITVNLDFQFSTDISILFCFLLFDF